MVGMDIAVYLTCQITKGGTIYEKDIEKPTIGLYSN
jgi:hypothetical protein